MKKMFFFLFALSTLTANAATLYWVNGTGNWSDNSHWSNTSGGSSCSCLPTAADNVIFDAASFSGGGQSVTINAQAYCKDMTWASGVTNPTLAGSSRLDIYGSLTFTTNMNVTYTGDIYFKSNSGNSTITTATKVVRSNLYFDGAGAWALQDSLVTYNTGNIISLLQGSLNTNNKYVYASRFESTGSGIRSLSLGSSTLIFTQGGCCSYPWYVGSSNFTINAGTSNIVLTGVGNYLAFLGDNFTYYNVSFTNATATYAALSTSATFNNVTFANEGSISGNNTFNDVSFGGDGSISGNNSFNNLSFAAGKTYTLSSNNTQIINGSLIADGTCATPTIIKCNSSTSPATISKSSGSITLNYVRLENINTTGAATFTANNVTDFGGNNGWTLNTPTPKTLYWIGNGGNWTNPAKWSATSGGTTVNCIPTPYDNVVFDAASFSGGGQSVTINAQAYCKDMTWASGVTNPTLAGSSRLDIYGSLTFTTNMNVTYTGDIYFKSNSGNSTITTATKVVRSNLYFDGAGAWALQDSLVTYNTGNIISLLQGSLNTNNKYVYASRFESTGSGIRSLSLGSSTLIFTQGGCCSYPWYVGSSNFTINAGTSNIVLTGVGNYLAFLGDNFTYYNVSFTNATATYAALSTSATFNNVTFANEGSISGNNTFNDVSFGGDGSISGNNSFNNLSFAAGKTYTLSSNNTQIINGSLIADGTCATPTIIKCNSSTSPATISKSSGSITLNYVRLENINTTGAATFTANNVTDFGGNNGWTLNTPTPKTLYWIGNGGNWTNPAKWSATSGGTTVNCIPTPYDNVVFDAASFSGGGQSVTINAQAYCKDMTWASGVTNPTLAGSSRLDIYGSLTFTTNMNVTYTGDIYFKSNSGNSTITTATKVVRSNLYFDGAGAWALQDSLVTYNTGNIISLLQGSLNTNNKYVYASRFESTGSGIRSLSLGSSTLIFTQGGCCSYPWYVGSSNFTINAGTSNIVLTGVGNYLAFLGDNFTYYNVSFTNATATYAALSTSATFNNVTFANEGSISGNNTFNDVSFGGDGSISGNNSFNNLSFAAGKTYTLSSNNTQIINGTIIGNGTQGSNTSIRSSNNGVKATINKNSGAICMEYVTLKDIAKTGAGTFNASVGSVDGGNNTGITFGPCAGQIARLDNITPNSGGNIGDVTVNVFGIFPGNCILRFTKTGQSPIVFADSLTININNTRLKATTNLAGKAIGLWNVEVQTPDTLMVLTNAFSVVAGIAPVISTQIIGSPVVRVNTWENFSISYTNNGNVNATGVPIWLVFPGTSKLEILSAKYQFPPNLGMDTLHGVIPIDSLDGQPLGATDSLICLLVASIPPNATGTINFRIKSSITGSIKLYSWSSNRFYASPLNPGLGACIDDLASIAVGYIPIPGVDCAYNTLRTLIDPAIAYSQTNSTDGLLLDFAQSVLETSLTCAFDLGLAPISTAYKIFNAVSNLNTAVSTYQSCSPLFPPNLKTLTQIQSVGSIDPNDKTGPVGAGPQGFYKTDQPISYRIRFENVDSATAPVHTVTVIDTLKSNKFDFSTFAFGFISVVDTVIAVPAGQKTIAVDHYIPAPVDVVVRVTANFNEQTGIATWNFASLEPSTLQPVTNPLKGFLHPNVTAPQGEGAVFFSVKTLNTLPQNATFTNTASIIFDNNAPIVTNTWSNTVDRIAPQSQVAALVPLQADTNFAVSWSGTDIGSGIKHYTIYHSTNGGSYTPWLVNTTSTTDIYRGKRDSTYRFFSIAVDSAGNIELAASSHDAITTVSSVTGVNSLDQIDLFEVYPNPNTGSFMITLKSAAIRQYEISCLNTLGAVIYSSYFEKKGDELKTEINLSDTPNGVYFVRVTSEGKSVYKKVIVTR